MKNIFPQKIRGDCFEKFKCDIIYRSATSLYLATAIPSFKNSVFGHGVKSQEESNGTKWVKKTDRLMPPLKYFYQYLRNYQNFSQAQIDFFIVYLITERVLLKG